MIDLFFKNFSIKRNNNWSWGGLIVINVNDFNRDKVSGIIPEILELSSNVWLEKIVKFKLLDIMRID